MTREIEKDIKNKPPAISPTPPVIPPVVNGQVAGGIRVVTGPETVPLPQEYAKLGVTMGYNPPGPEELRIFVTGLQGNGKSTFVAGIPNTLVIDTEKAQRTVPLSRAHRVSVSSLTQLDALIGKLCQDGREGRARWKRIMFDTVDELVAIVETALAVEKNVEDITELGREGHGWALVRNRVWGFIKMLEEAGYSWGMVGHLKEVQEPSPVTGKMETRIRALVFKTLAASIIRNVDIHISTCSRTALVPEMREVTLPNGSKVNVKKGDRYETRYYLITIAAEGFEGKRRGVPGMRDIIELPDIGSGQFGWDVFEREYMRTVECVRKGLKV